MSAPETYTVTLADGRPWAKGVSGSRAIAAEREARAAGLRALVIVRDSDGAEMIVEHRALAEAAREEEPA